MTEQTEPVLVHGRAVKRSLLHNFNQLGGKAIRLSISAHSHTYSTH
jgi:hypothetical protein